jgi:hypothetical protein
MLCGAFSTYNVLSPVRLLNVFGEIEAISFDDKSLYMAYDVGMC